MSLQPIRLVPARRALMLALPLLQGLCLAAPASALTAYAPGYDPDKEMLQMATMKHRPTTTAGGLPDRSPAPLGTPIGALTGSPGTGSLIVDIGKGLDGDGRLPNPTTYYAVTGLSIVERGNDPCELILYGRMVDSRYRATGSKARIVARHRLDKCHTGVFQPLLEKGDVGFDEYRDVFLRAVQVCGGHSASLLGQGAYASNVWEVKGYRVRGAILSPESGEVTPMPVRDEHEEPRCPGYQAGAWGAGWTGWSACDEGELMTGLRVHTYKDKWFTGFTARCKDVVRRQPITDPVRD